MTLRTRVVLVAVASAVAVLVLLVVPVALLVRSNAHDAAEQDAVAAAQGVADYVSTGAATDARLAAYVARINDRDDARPVTVVLADGDLVGADQPRCTDPDADGDDDQGAGGDTDQDGGASGLAATTAAEVVDVADGRLLRIESATPGGPVAVCAFVSDASVADTVRERLSLLGGAALLVLAAVAGLAVVVTRRITQPLVATSQVADRLAEGDLGARAVDDGPLEVRHVGTALNRLAGRIEELLQHERETVADLSHRLRTPLTAVRLDVEALPEGPGKARLEGSLAQVERTLSTVIRTARRADRAGVLDHADVVAVVRDRFDFWSPLLEEQERDPALVVEAPDGTVVALAADDLASALDALLANTTAHTAYGTAVRVVVQVVDPYVVVDVCDQGPGIPESALVRGRSDRGSTGLGLDIARSTAEASGGSFRLLRDGAWQVVRLELGHSTRTR